MRRTEGDDIAARRRKRRKSKAATDFEQESTESAEKTLCFEPFALFRGYSFGPESCQLQMGIDGFQVSLCLFVVRVDADGALETFDRFAHLSLLEETDAAAHFRHIAVWI